MLTSFMKFVAGKWSNVNVSASDPLPVNIIGGGNDLSVLIVEDALGVKHIRREIIDEVGTVTITYENFDGTAATPTAPITVASAVLPIGASTSAKQDELRGTQGTGSSYNPPTGGSGIFGWLSGIYKEISGGLKLKLGGSDVSASNPLPTYGAVGTSTASETIAGRLHVIKTTKGAVSGQFARLQIHNAGTSSLQVANILLWAGTAGTHTYSIYEVGTHDASATLSNAVTNCKLGDAPSAAIAIYGASSATAIQTTNIIGISTSTVIVPSGVGLVMSGAQINIPAGKTLEIAIGTANVSLNLLCAVAAL